MIIKWREQTEAGEVEHEFDWAGAPKTKEMRWVKERTEFRGTLDFLEALERMDPDAIAALVCLLCARHGRAMKIDDVDIDPINDLDFIMNTEESARAKLIQTINDTMNAAPGKAPDAGPPVQTSGPSNGLLSAAVSNPSSGITLRTSGDGTDSTSMTSGN